MKRVVVLKIKGEKEEKVYTTCAELVVKNDKAAIGVGLGALWNALSKGNGAFENNKCRVFYRNVENVKKTEWK